MATFREMQQRYQNSLTIGQQLKASSDMVMQSTWDNDIGTRMCYIYDYYHDDQKELQGGNGYHPELSISKIPVKLKFIIKEYKSASKDDPEYHIQFEPDVWNSMSCKPDWFVDEYERLGIHFPVGLYVDIPDDRGVYWKWLIFYDETANQFPKFGVVKCNYYFQWNEGFNDNGRPTIRKMWGVERTAQSYTSGVWTGDKFTTYDEQDKFWLPFNNITSEIVHDMRFIISMPRKKPFVYKITKVSDTVPKGVIMFTLKQTEFNQFVDYVNLETQEMIADYYASKVDISDEDDDTTTDGSNIDGSNSEDDSTVTDNVISLNVDDGDNNIMISNNKRIIATCDSNINLVWKFSIDENEIDESIGHDAISKITYINNKEVDIKLSRTRKYKGSIIKVYAESYTNSDINDSIELNIVI